MHQLRVETGLDTVRIILDRAEQANALNAAMLTALADAVRAAGPMIRTIVLAGAGPDFSTGGDVLELRRAVLNGSAHEVVRAGVAACSALKTSEAVTIAALAGRTQGAAVVLAACCDIRIAADTAAFSLPELRIGVPPIWGGGAARLIAEIGASRARYLALSGRPIDAETAAAWGLVHTITPLAELDTHVTDLQQQISRYAKDATLATKAHLRAVQEHDWAGLETSWLTAALTSHASTVGHRQKQAGTPLAL